MNGLMKHFCSSPHACILLPAFVVFLQENINVLLTCSHRNHQNKYANLSKNLLQLCIVGNTDRDSSSVERLDARL